MEGRRFIRAAVSAAGVTPLAGCPSGDDGDGFDDDGDADGGDADDGGSSESEFPSYGISTYAEWPPEEARTRDFVLFGHINITHLHQEEEDEEEQEGEDDLLDEDDVLLTMPFFGGMTTALWFYLGLWGYPWQGVLGSENEPDGMETEALTVTEGTFIFHGEYDAQVFTDEHADGFDEREVDGFTVFEGRDGENTEELAYAVADDAVVGAISPEDGDGHEEVVGNLEDALENRVDEAGRILDDADGEWLFETTGEADMVTGFWRIGGLEEDHLDAGDGEGEEPDGNEEADEDDAESVADEPVFDNVDSFLSTLALPEDDGGVGGEDAAARFAALYPEGEVPSEDEFREGLLADDTEGEMEVSTGDDRAHVEVQTTVEEIEETD